MKKKYGLFKVLAVMLLLIVVTTYFIDARGGNIQYLALGDVVLNYVQSFYYFFDTAVFILVVGGFYGFLNRIPAYKKLVKKIASKASNKSMLFVIVTTIVFAIFSSLTGVNLLLLIFIPFVISIILLLGYDKLVAISATIGGTIVGIMGGVFFTLRDPNSYSYVTFDKFVGLDSNWVNLFPRILLLVVATGLLIFYITGHVKKVKEGKVKYKLSKSDSLFIEVKDKTGKVVEVKEGKVGFIPLIIVLILFTIILVLGYFPWNSLFGIEVFNKFHTWLTGIKIGDYVVFNNLFTANITAFGTWKDLGNFMVSMFAMIVTMLILMPIYRIKFEDAMDGFILGVKKLFAPLMVAMLAYCVLVCCYNNGFMETVVTTVGDKVGDNVVLHSLITVLGSILNVDIYYVAVGIFTNITTNLTDSANLSIYSVMFQSVYGLVQLIGPTSILLILGLTYLEVPYKTWLKYIWRFIIELLIVIMLVLMLVSLL